MGKGEDLRGRWEDRQGGCAGRWGDWEGKAGARRTGGSASTAETRRSARLLRWALLRRLRGGKQAAAHLALGEG